ncbi:hypothetical protein ACIOGT_16835 [Streptomyces microflavus]|uniref:hypothetical protein n=1 Tax=Streptomyces microflavus TaxID=1919 RepID=UPI0038300F17
MLVSGGAWRALPPCFGTSKSTAHRRFVICREPACGAGCLRRFCSSWTNRTRSACPGRSWIPRTCALEGAELAGPSPVGRDRPGSRMHVLSDAYGLPLRVGALCGRHPRQPGPETYAVPFPHCRTSTDYESAA